MGIGTEIEAAIDLMLNSYISTKSAALCTAIIPIALTGATIHLLLMGYAIMRGEAEDTLHTFLWKSFRTAMVASIALSAGAFQATVVDGSNGIEGALIESLSGLHSVGALVDDMAKPFSDLGIQIWNQAVVGFWPNFGLVVAAASVAIAEFFVVSIGLGLYLLAKVALALVLAVGPVFIMCAMWPATEKYAESWIGQALNYVLMKVLVAMSIAMLMIFASQYAAHVSVTADAVNVIKATTSLIVCSGALAVVMLNLPHLASALAGGASISGIGRTIGRACVDLLNKSKDASASTKGGGEIAPRESRRNETPGGAPTPPPRAPLFQRNTIEHLRKHK